MLGQYHWIFWLRWTCRRALPHRKPKFALTTQSHHPLQAQAAPTRRGRARSAVGNPPRLNDSGSAPPLGCSDASRKSRSRWVTSTISLTPCGRAGTRHREEFNKTALRRLAVLAPPQAVTTNHPRCQVEELGAITLIPFAGTGRCPFQPHVIHRAPTNFMETPPPKYFRLRPGGESRVESTLNIIQ